MFQLGVQRRPSTARNAWSTSPTTFDGPGSSVRRYYEEVSYRATPCPRIQRTEGNDNHVAGGWVADGFDIDYAWGDLFEHPNPKALWDAWNPKGDTWDILGGEFSSFLCAAVAAEHHHEESRLVRPDGAACHG